MKHHHTSLEDTVSVGTPLPAAPLGLGLALACIVLIALDLRPGLVSIGPILPAIRSEFGLSHTMAALLTSIPDLLLGLLALPTPWLAQRFGRDRTIIAALMLLGVAMVARAAAPDTAALLLATAGVGAGIAVAGALIGAFIKASFPTKAAFVMGIYATSLSIGSTLSAALTGPAMRLSGGSWRIAAGVWALLSITAIAAWLVIIRKTPRPSADHASRARHNLPWRNHTAWLVALYFGGLNLLFYALISWIAPLFQEAGLSLTKAGLVLASFTAAFTLANPIFGSLSKSEDRRALLAIAAALAAIGLVVMTMAPLSAPFLYVPVTAFGLGGSFTLGMTLPLDNAGSPEEATAWNAFVYMIGYLIAAIGPLSVGVLRDVTGTFSAAVALLLIVAIGMMAISPFLQPHAHKLARKAKRAAKAA
jgi:CP family cyanate transporter-like MFS transporter